MTQTINAEVTYIDDDELFLEARKKPINDLNWHDVKDWSFVQRASILIVKRGFEYKVLKSRY